MCRCSSRPSCIRCGATSPPQLDPDRGLRRGALARHAAARCASDQGRGRGLRAAGDGVARRHDLDRGARARAHPRLGADRRRRRRPRWLARADWGAERALHRHRRDLVRHRADHRRALRDHPTPDIARFVLNMPLVKIDSIGAGCGLVRARRTRTRAGRSSGRTRRGRRSASAGRRAASTRSRSPTSTSSSGASTPTTSSAARSRSTSSAPGRGQAPGRRPARTSGVEQAAAGVIELFERRCATRRSAASSARATAPPTTRCSATAAAGRCTSPATPRASPTARCWCPAWAAGFSRLRLRVRRVRVPLRPPGRPARSSPPRTRWRRRGWAAC